MANLKPVEIGAMPNAGASRDGQLIFFDFACHDGQTYKFKVTHEAMPTIIELLIKCAAEAGRVRGDTFTPGQIVSGQRFDLQTFVTAVSAEGSAVLVLESPGRSALSVLLSREQCSVLSQSLAELSSRLAPPPDPSMPN